MKTPPKYIMFSIRRSFNLQQELHAIFIANQILNLNNHFTFLNYCKIAFSRQARVILG